MSDEDYLVARTDGNVLKNLAKMGERLKELRLDMDAKEQAYKDAKKEHDYYAGTILPMEMFNAGVSSVELMTGGCMQYDRKYYCQPNKNEEDKRAMAAWLREHGGEHLIKERAAVDASQVDKLAAAGIPFVEIADINTNSLKAFLKDLLGGNGGTPQVSADEIPACIHFQEVGVVSIDV
jgi:hypothetical protein